MEFIQIQVQERESRGSRAMRLLRSAGEVPGVLYGLGRRNLPLSIPGESLERFLRSGSHLVELKMGDATRDAILRELQVDPVTDQVLHVDLQRVDKDAEVEDAVPVVFKGTAKGTREGGLFQGLMDRVRVRARPRDIPREILLDISDLTVGDEIKIRDLEVASNVTLVDEEDDMIAHVVAMRGVPAEEEEGIEGEGQPTEPEVVGKPGAEGGAGD